MLLDCVGEEKGKPESWKDLENVAKSPKLQTYNHCAARANKGKHYEIPAHSFIASLPF